MSHFYGGISGNRGPATRQGSKDSGYSAYAQGYGSRISVSFHYNERDDCDSASISISGGWASQARGRGIGFNDIDAVVEALDSGDPKIEKIWQRIQSEFDKLESEARPALDRAAKAREKEERRQRREERELAARIKELRDSITHAERHYYVAIIQGLTEDERMEIYPTDDKIDDDIVRTYGRPEPYRDERGHLIVGQRAGGTWGRLRLYDVTAAVEVEELLDVS